MSFKEDANLDINELDKACLEQPRLYAEWSSLWAEAVRLRDKLKERLTAKKMEVDELIRKNPEEFGWDNASKSPTEVWVANRLLQNEEVISLSEELIEAQYGVNKMASAKETMDHRLKSLSILSELYKGSYFSASSKGTAFVQDAVTKSQEKQRVLLNSHPEAIALKKKLSIKKKES